jgi:predicted PhzF superfamily epimerase YddE/YHI9
MPIDLSFVDAFTAEPFRGNPAAVCLPDRELADAFMQSVAAEMNLSETAFPVPQGEGWRLRWFTPKAEVDLCGHATLASAHVLWETGRLPLNRPAVFATRSGRLTCVRRGGWIEMDFPAEPADALGDAALAAELAAALNAAGRVVGRKRNRMDDLVELDSPAAVRAITPDFARLAALPARGVIVTARSDDPRYDFVSRFFAPAVGVNEDPVTGSAHCCLGPYWAAKLGKPDLLAYQCSPRGGVVRVSVRGDRVLLGGQAVTVQRAQLLVSP